MRHFVFHSSGVNPTIVVSIPTPAGKYLWDVSLAINLCRVLLLLLRKSDWNRWNVLIYIKSQSFFSQGLPRDVEYLQVYEGEVSRLG